MHTQQTYLFSYDNQVITLYKQSLHQHQNVYTLLLLLLLLLLIEQTPNKLLRRQTRRSSSHSIDKKGSSRGALRATNFEKISRSQKKKRTEVEQSLFPSFHPSATFLLHRIRRTQNCPLLSHTPSLCLLDAMMTYYHASSSSSRAPFGGYIRFTSRIRSVVVTKKTHHTCVFKKKRLLVS